MTEDMSKAYITHWMSVGYTVLNWIVLRMLLDILTSQTMVLLVLDDPLQTNGSRSRAVSVATMRHIAWLKRNHSEQGITTYIKSIVFLSL
jgi:hypothetical protein